MDPHHTPSTFGTAEGPSDSYGNRTGSAGSRDVSTERADQAEYPQSSREASSGEDEHRDHNSPGLPRAQNGDRGAGASRSQMATPPFETWREFLLQGRGAGSPRDDASGSPGVDGSDDSRDSSSDAVDAATWRRARGTRRSAGLFPARNASDSIIHEPELAEQEAIDLRTPPGAPPEDPDTTISAGSRNSAPVVLPPWQPDSEVPHCPICGKQFTFWNRKHHCRKCGRVVCALCSPHRITIPRQYIVHPPTATGPSPSTSRRHSQVIDLTGDELQDDDNRASVDMSNLNNIDLGLGGGAEVRICNPCVPDPNTAPPPQVDHSPSSSRSVVDQPSTHPSRSSRPGSWTPRDIDRTGSFDARRRTSAPYASHRDYTGRRSRDQVLSAQDRYMGLGARGVLPQADPADEANPTARRRTRGVTFADHTPSRSPPRYPDPYRSSQELTHSVVPPRSSSNFAPDYPSQAFGPSTSAPTSGYHHYPPSSAHHPHHHHHHQRQAPSLGSNVFSGQESHLQSMHNVSGPATHRYPGPGPPRRLREEDYCPVCHTVLPPKGPNGDESARESHIQECVATHFLGSGGGGVAESTPPASSNVTDRPLPPTPFPAQASSSTSALPGTEASTVRPASGTQAALSPYLPVQDQSQASAVRRRRSTGAGNRMITYLATEKDCMVNDEDPGGPGREGSAAQTKQVECVICFEEFEVGDEMARLECLCKFHRRCIRSWWERKGGGCPVHQETS